VSSAACNARPVRIRFFSTLSIHLHSCQGGPLPSTLSSRLERIRISYIAVPPKATYAAFARKAARSSSTPLSWTGNPEERRGEPALSEVERGPAVSLGPHANANKRSKANPILFETQAPPHNQRITCTPSTIYSLIWTAACSAFYPDTTNDTEWFEDSDMGAR